MRPSWLDPDLKLKVVLPPKSPQDSQGRSWDADPVASCVRRIPNKSIKIYLDRKDSWPPCSNPWLSAAFSAKDNSICPQVVPHWQIGIVSWIVASLTMDCPRENCDSGRGGGSREAMGRQQEALCSLSMDGLIAFCFLINLFSLLPTVLSAGPSCPRWGLCPSPIIQKSDDWLSAKGQSYLLL